MTNDTTNSPAPTVGSSHADLTINRHNRKGRGWSLNIRLDLTGLILLISFLLSHCDSLPLP